MMFLGVVVCLWILIAFIVSIVSFFTEELFLEANIWTKTTHECQLNRHTYFGYIRDCLAAGKESIRQKGETATGNAASAFVFGFFFSPDSVVFHQQACFLVFLRCMTIF